jgi:EAL domain-containing protein (putative c-di-GMP-specific phosphodiesterase class I)
MTQPEDKIIVESTINLAHKLGLTVVAEGIEDEATLIWLKDNGCEMAQGFFISRPLPAHQLSQWLTTCQYQKTGKVSKLREV